MDLTKQYFRVPLRQNKLPVNESKQTQNCGVSIRDKMHVSLSASVSEKSFCSYKKVFPQVSFQVLGYSNVGMQLRKYIVNYSILYNCKVFLTL